MGVFSRNAEAAQRRDERRQRLEERVAASAFATEVRRLKGLRVNADRIAYKGTGGPLAGAHATVEAVADALRKKKDHRELYLTVEGDGFAFVVPVDADRGVETRRVAARINTLAARATQVQ